MAIQLDLSWYKFWLAIGWLLVATVIILSLIPQPAYFKVELHVSDKFHHFIAYAALFFWFAQIYHQLTVRIVYALGFVLLGLALEILQSFTVSRTFEWYDLAANTSGVLTAVVVIQLFAWDNLLWRFEQKWIKA